MASEWRKPKPNRKLTGGISKSRARDTGFDHRENHGVKISVKNYNDNRAGPPEIDEERFEHLKDMYFKQCQPINMNLIRKLTEKCTASNYNYQNSAQFNRVLGPGIVGSSGNVSNAAQRGHRDVAAKPREDNKPNSSSKGQICPKCHGRHY